MKSIKISGLQYDYKVIKPEILFRTNSECKNDSSHAYALQCNVCDKKCIQDCSIPEERAPDVKDVDSKNDKDDLTSRDNNDNITVDEITKIINEKMITSQKQQKNGLTLSGLLNAIDGIFNNDGRILIMTTNHPEVLDGALIRPGRIDRKLLFGYCDPHQINGIFEMMYDVNLMDNCDDGDSGDANNNYIEGLKMITENIYSPADITSLFLKYRNKPEMALKNIEELDNNDFTVDRKFFGASTMKKITQLNTQTTQSVQSISVQPTHFTRNAISRSITNRST
jgi:hypothetical protein